MKKIKVVVVLFTILALTVLYYTAVDKNTVQKRMSGSAVAEQIGLNGYLLLDVINTMKELLPEDQNEMINLKNEFFSSREVKEYEFLQGKNGNDKNVILLQLEGVDSVAINAKFNGEFIMPNLQKLSNSGILFKNAFDVTGSGRTSDGEFATLTSLVPIENESMFTFYELSHIDSLPKKLKENGYDCYSFHGNVGEFWNRELTHKMLGYDYSFFEDEIEECENDYQGWGRSDRSVLTKMYEVIENADNKVMLHGIMLSNHHPFEEANNMNIDLPFPDPDGIVENYWNSLYYTDYVIGIFIKKLEDSGLLEESILVIYSDHDSGITKNVYEYLGLDYQMEDVKYDKIPLIFYDGKNSYVEDLIVGQTDIMPLILSYLDINTPPDIMGMNYRENGKVVYLQKGLFSKDFVMDADSFDVAIITKAVVNYSQEELYKNEKD